MTMTNAEPAIAADRKIEAGPPRQASTKADALRRALAQLQQARALAEEIEPDTNGAASDLIPKERAP
jgi:hypothetical protein